MPAGRAKSFDDADHRALAIWAADCAERVLRFFEAKYPKDRRPRDAIEAARAWTRGELRVGLVRVAAVAAHAAARDAVEGAPRAAARAAGQAAAVAHLPGHARHAAAYAVKAVAPGVAASERAWQRRHLPRRLHPRLLLDAGEG